jgi:hypothetical protein
VLAYVIWDDEWRNKSALVHGGEQSLIAGLLQQLVIPKERLR